jgi:PAS domain S-box-containing protein
MEKKEKPARKQSRIALGIVLFSGIIFLLIYGWYAVISHYNMATKIIIQTYQQTELEIVRSMARSVENYVQFQIEKLDRTDIEEIEQEIFKLFIAPVCLLDNGDAWIYAPDHVVFDLSSDFPDKYRGKSMAEIFAIQKEYGAGHYQDMTESVMNGREDVGWYIWLPDKGKEIAAWTPVEFDEHVWIIGISTPLPEIIKSTGTMLQLRTFIIIMGAATIIMVGLLLILAKNVIQLRRTTELTHTQLQLELVLSKLTGLDSLLRSCVEGAIRISQMDCGGIYLVNEATGTLDLSYHSGLPDNFVKSSSHYGPYAPSTILIKKGKPVYSHYHKLGLPLNGVHEKEGLRAIAILPVLHNGKVIACLNVASHKKDLVPIESRNALELIASRIGSFIARAMAEEALKQSEQLYRTTIDSMSDFIHVVDRDLRIVLYNRTFLNHISELGIESDLTGKDLFGLFPFLHSKARKEYEQVLNTGKAVITLEETEIDHSSFWTETHKIPIFDQEGRIYRIISIIRDITERKKLEEDLFKAHKLESIGVLAGGIAHDFNNIIMAIQGNISLAKLDIKPEAEVCDLLEEAEKACNSAKGLTRQLLTFSRGGTPVKKTASIQELIKDTSTFALRGSNVSYKFKAADDLSTVEIDEGQIGQVINNLVINASQAMPDGGVIRIAVENITVEADHNLPLDAGKYIKIIIKDSGIGIPEKNLSKVFDPYFTTKTTGSGLGLAATYSIIRNHGGHISVDSEEGAGTTFSVYLPASQNDALSGEKEVKVKETLLKGNGKILIMDDEEIIRRVAGKMVESLGYSNAFAEHGEQAVELYKEEMDKGTPFDAVIMDLTIPGGMGGRKAIEKLLEIDPGVRAIVSSGYSNDPVMANYKKYGFMGIIGKPYQMEELSEVLIKVLKEEE